MPICRFFFFKLFRSLFDLFFKRVMEWDFLQGFVNLYKWMALISRITISINILIFGVLAKNCVLFLLVSWWLKNQQNTRKKTINQSLKWEKVHILNMFMHNKRMVQLSKELVEFCHQAAPLKVCRDRTQSYKLEKVGKLPNSLLSMKNVWK